MMSSRSIALATGVALGALAFVAGTNSGEAAALTASGVLALPEAAQTGSLVIEARHPHRHARQTHRHRHREGVRHRHQYQPRAHGPRLRHRTTRHRHYHDGYWYAFPFWLYSIPAYDDYDDHVNWCLGRYRSYDPDTDMYLGYDGRYHRCRSPYRP